MQRIYFLRHGQSTFNAVYDRTGVDPMIFDAKLSACGWKQVDAVAAQVHAIRPDVIVSSPLSRALQTASGVRGATGAAIRVEAMHREHQVNSCDIGLPRTRLSQVFPALDFRQIPEIWWSTREPDGDGIVVETLESVRDRADLFVGWLRRRSEKNILVVGHSGFFSLLTRYYMKNCELIEWTGD